MRQRGEAAEGAIVHIDDRLNLPWIGIIPASVAATKIICLFREKDVSASHDIERGRPLADNALVMDLNARILQAITNSAPPAPVELTAEAPPSFFRLFSRWFLLIALALFCLAGRFCYTFNAFTGDSSMFIAMGKLVAHGGRIGVELIDNKLPAIGMIFAGFWRLFGANWPLYILAQTILVMASLGLLCRAVRMHIGPHAAGAVALFGLVFLNLCYAVSGGFQLEPFQSSFGMIAAASAMSAFRDDDARDSFVVGLCAGCAAMFKPTGGFILIAYAASIIATRPRFSRLLAHAFGAFLGLMVPVGLSLYYFAEADLFPHLPAIWRMIGRYVIASQWAYTDIGKWIIAAVVCGFPFAVRAWVCRRSEYRCNEQCSSDIVRFGAFWLLAEVLGVLAGGRMYPYHFMALFTPMTLLFGLIPRVNRRWPIAIGFAPALLISAIGIYQSVQNAENPYKHLPISNYIAAHTQPGDRVWRDEMIRMMLETEIRPGSRHLTTFLWANFDDASTEYSARMIEDFEQFRPKYIVLPTHLDDYIHKFQTGMKELALNPRRSRNFGQAWNSLRDYVNAHYTAEAQVGRETVYRRGDSQAIATIDDD